MEDSNISLEFPHTCAYTGSHPPERTHEPTHTQNMRAHMRLAEEGPVRWPSGEKRLVEHFWTET